MITARDILNKARWARGDLYTLAVTVVHRGAPGDVRTLSGARIVDIGSAGISLTPELAESETVFVPYHRFVAIHAADGALLWDRHGASVGAPPVAAAQESEPRPAAEATGGREIAPSFSVVLPSENTLVLDGSAGEGGGQVLRTGLTLSMWTGTPFVLERVRAGRSRPGLMRQHLTSVLAAAAACSAEVEGAALGSTRISFRPRAAAGGTHTLDVGSAGSVALVLQTLAFPLALSAQPARVTVRGGTHAAWAPIYEFLAEAWLPRAQQAGARLGLSLKRAGFYPAGGGEVEMTTEPSAALMPLHLAGSSGQLDLTLDAIVANLPESVARRPLTIAAEALAGEVVRQQSRTVGSPGAGSAMWLTSRDRVTGACNVFSAIGEPGRSDEEVAAEVVRAFLAFRDSGASVEPHLADQLMVPMAMAGEGSFTTRALTLHSRTNMEVIHAFTGRRLRASELRSGQVRVTLEPCAGG